MEAFDVDISGDQVKTGSIDEHADPTMKSDQGMIVVCAEIG